MIRQAVSRRFADPDFLNKTVTLFTLLNERWSNSLIFMITNLIEQAYHISSQNVRYTKKKLIIVLPFLQEFTMQTH